MEGVCANAARAWHPDNLPTLPVDGPRTFRTLRTLSGTRVRSRQNVPSKIHGRVRRVISARSSRAEAAQGLNARRKAHHRSRAFEATQRVIHKKVGLMPFEIARPGHRISVPAQECGAEDRYKGGEAWTPKGSRGHVTIYTIPRTNQEPLGNRLLRR